MLKAKLKTKVSMICQTLKVSRSQYYARKNMPITAKEREIEKLGAIAKQIFKENNSEYGRIRLCKALRDSGIVIGQTKTGRIMREFGIRPKTIKKYKATTNSNHRLPVAENMLNREFKQEKPNTVWCGDSTYIWTDEGWLYAAGMIDLCDKTCVGISFSERHTNELVAAALENAVRRYGKREGLMFHSDRGVQYASNNFRNKLKEYGMVQSMSRRGNPYDNAPMESFWGTVKKGCIHGERFKTRAEAKKAIINYVLGFYNNKRYHSDLDYTTPSKYRAKKEAGAA